MPLARRLKVPDAYADPAPRLNRNQFRRSFHCDLIEPLLGVRYDIPLINYPPLNGYGYHPGDHDKNLAAEVNAHTPVRSYDIAAANINRFFRARWRRAARF